MSLTSKLSKRNDPIRLLRLAIAFIALILCVWVVFLPRPYYWAIGAAFAFVPALVFGSLIERAPFSLVDPSRSDGNTINLFYPFFFVSGALAWRTMADFQTTSDLDLLRLTVPVAFFLALLAWVVIKKTSFPAALVFAVMYALPLVVQINDIGPPSGEVVFKGLIYRKYSSIKPVTYTIVIRSGSEEKHVRVSKRAYSNYSLVSPVCVKEVKGWLGISTRFPVRCE